MNSHKVYWQHKNNGTFAVIPVDKSAVGHCISTKAVGSDERVDITHFYKNMQKVKILTKQCCQLRYFQLHIFEKLHLKKYRYFESI